MRRTFISSSVQHPVLPGGDLLLLCGDTVIAQYLVESRTDRKSIDHRKVAEQFFAREVTKYARALVLMGNHEHYYGFIDDTPGLMRRLLATHAPNARLLDNQVEVIEGVAFLGSTLWAPCCHPGHPFRNFRLRFSMNDFRQILNTDGTLFAPQGARARHEAAVAWLKAEMPNHHRVVVMTHHAPSLQSPTKYKATWAGDLITPAYCSDQEALMLANPHVSHWVHGHTHVDVDYTVGATRVVSNQRGYVGHERIATRFDPKRVAFEL